MQCGETTPLLLKGAGIVTDLACSALTRQAVSLLLAAGAGAGRWGRKDGAVRPAPAPAPFAMRHDIQGTSMCC